MRLLSLLRWLPFGSPRRSRGPELRARLSLNGFERLEERIQPSLSSFIHSHSAVVQQVLDHTPPAFGPIASTLKQEIRILASQFGQNQNPNPPPPPLDNGGSTANATLSGMVFVDGN